MMNRDVHTGFLDFFRKCIISLKLSHRRINTHLIRSCKMREQTFYLNIRKFCDLYDFGDGSVIVPETDTAHTGIESNVDNCFLFGCKRSVRNLDGRIVVKHADPYIFPNQIFIEFIKGISQKHDRLADARPSQPERFIGRCHCKAPHVIVRFHQLGDLHTAVPVTVSLDDRGDLTSRTNVCLHILKIIKYRIQVNVCPDPAVFFHNR